MIANWMEGVLILSPETDEDEQALKALAAACPELIWGADLLRNPSISKGPRGKDCSCDNPARPGVDVPDVIPRPLGLAGPRTLSRPSTT